MIEERPRVVLILVLGDDAEVGCPGNMEGGLNPFLASHRSGGSRGQEDRTGEPGV